MHVASNETNIEHLKAQIDLRQYIAQELGQPRRHHRAYWTWHCPFHRERTPSFHVWHADYHCFGCGAHGDILTWLEARHQLSFKAAVQELGGTSLHSLDKHQRVNLAVGQIDERRPPADAWQQAAWSAIVECEALLYEPEGATARQWLYEQRGLNHWIWEEVHLGYNPATRIFPGLGTVERGILIPHLDLAGRVWELNLRRPATTGQRYICVPGSVKGSLYGVQTCPAAAIVVITEGEFDALLLWQVLHTEGIGVATTGATGGHTTANLTNPHVTVPLLHVQQLLIATDTDPAGNTAAGNWLAATRRARRIVVPSGKDITAYWQQSGGRNSFGAGYDALRAWIHDTLQKEAA